MLQDVCYTEPCGGGVYQFLKDNNKDIIKPFLSSESYSCREPTVLQVRDAGN